MKQAVMKEAGYNSGGVTSSMEKEHALHREWITAVGNFYGPSSDTTNIDSDDSTKIITPSAWDVFLDEALPHPNLILEMLRDDGRDEVLDGLITATSSIDSGRRVHFDKKELMIETGVS